MRTVAFFLSLPIWIAFLVQPLHAQYVYDCFGDSITEGYDANLGMTGGYVPYLAAYLNERVGPSAVVNSGKSGEKTTQGINRFPDALSAANPHFVLIMEGTNDISQGLTSEEILQNLTSMVDTAQNMNVRPILGTVVPRVTDLDHRDPDNARAQALAEGIASLASQRGLRVADQFTRFDGPGYNGSLFSDHLHPNDHGYRVMAQEWLDAIIRELIAQGLRNGDIDGSGRIDGWDLYLLGFYFGLEFGDGDFFPLADLNMDTVIDGQDLSILSTHFGETM